MTSVDASRLARIVGIETKFQRRQGGGFFLPQQLYVVGQGATATTYTSEKFTATRHGEVGDRVGYGSPLHRAAMKLLPDNGDGVGSIPVTFAPLQDDGSGVASTGTITPTGSPTAANAPLKVIVNKTKSAAINIVSTDAIADICDKLKAAIDAVLHMPVTVTDNATDVDLVSKWLGVSANDIKIELEGTVPGVSFAIVQPTGGANNPAASAVTTALNLMGNVWQSMVLNCLDIADTDVLDAINTHGEGRWGRLVKKPYVAFTGNLNTTVSAAIAVPDARKTDRINAQLVAPGSFELPCDVAARQLARIIRLANNNPAHAYDYQKATTISPGNDEDQWDAAQRDLALKGGSSTIEVVDGVVNISDVVTFYHPDGEAEAPYRYVVDIVKLQQAIFNLEVKFNNPEWAGAPLIPDDQPTTNRSAKKPSMFLAAVNGIIDFLGGEAIISDPAASKAAASAAISSTNPKRIDQIMPIQVSGNNKIHSIDLLWSFYYGELAAA